MKPPDLTSQDPRSLNATLARKPAGVTYATFDEIASVACRYMGVPQWTIYDTGRHPRTVAARELIVILCRELTLLSLPQIAVAMRRRNHSTVGTQLKRWHRRVRQADEMETAKYDTPRGVVHPYTAFVEVRDMLNERTVAA
jgi:chromosomal replication initiation ATPase DnaA